MVAPRHLNCVGTAPKDAAGMDVLSGLAAYTGTRRFRRFAKHDISINRLSGKAIQSRRRSICAPIGFSAEVPSRRLQCSASSTCTVLVTEYLDLFVVMKVMGSSAIKELWMFPDTPLIGISSTSVAVMSGQCVDRESLEIKFIGELVLMHASKLYPVSMESIVET